MNFGYKIPDHDQALPIARPEGSSTCSDRPLSGPSEQPNRFIAKNTTINFEPRYNKGHTILHTDTVILEYCNTEGE